MSTVLTLTDLDSSTQSSFAKPRISSVVVMTDGTFTTVNNSTTISPSYGNYVKILGSGFTNNEQIFIRSIGSKGANLAPLINYVSSTQVNCLLPPSNSGTKMLYVVNNDGATAITIVTYQ
jgi:IPT/TIG domain